MDYEAIGCAGVLFALFALALAGVLCLIFHSWVPLAVYFGLGMVIMLFAMTS